MKILILGAGQVGASVAASLAGEDDDITVVDKSGELLDSLQEHYDIRTVQGKASHPEVLARAGAEDADLILAVTNSDETNMIACQICHNLYHTPTKIARIRHNAYLSNHLLFGPEAIPIDMIISPETLVTDHIERLINHPNALQVLNFADGKVQLIAVKVMMHGPLVNQPIKALRQYIPKSDTRITAIFRGGEAIVPDGDTIIRLEDEVFFIAEKQDAKTVMAQFRPISKPYKRILLAGGGNIGARLAKNLEPHYQVKVIENNPKRAEYLSESLDHAVVLLGDAADKALLVEEDIDNVDLFCALTNDDEANILSALLAKKLGAKKVLSLINRAAYVDLVESNTIDIAISPQQATIGSLLAHIRHGDVVAVHSLRRGAAEALEAIAHGDKYSSRVVGRQISDIPLPPETTIGAIVRGDTVLITHQNIVIEAGDHIILFLGNKQYIPDVEQLFSVDITFF